MIRVKKIILYYRVRRLLPIYRCIICGRWHWGLGDIATDVGRPIARWGLMGPDCFYDHRVGFCGFSEGIARFKRF